MAHGRNSQSTKRTARAIPLASGRRLRRVNRLRFTVLQNSRHDASQVSRGPSPVEVNRAGRAELLRVPGVGPKGAEAILTARRRATLRSVDELRRIGVRTRGIEPYVLLDGRRP